MVFQHLFYEQYKIQHFHGMNLLWEGIKLRDDISEYQRFKHENNTYQ